MSPSSTMNHTTIEDNALDVVRFVFNATAAAAGDDDGLLPTTLNTPPNDTVLNEAVSILLLRGYTFSAAPYDPTSLAELFAVVLCSVFIFVMPIILYATSCCLKRRGVIPPLGECRQHIITFARKIQNPGAQLTEERRKFGIEKAAVLLVERELTRILVFLSVLGLVVLTPTHLLAGGGIDTGKLSSFSRTTIQNLSFETTQDIVWLHCVFTLLFSSIVFAGIQRIRVLLTRLEEEDQTPRQHVEAMIFASGPASSYCAETEMANALSMICTGLGVKSVRHLDKRNANASSPSNLPWRAIITFESTEGAREFLRDGKNYFLRSAKELLRLAIVQSPVMTEEHQLVAKLRRHTLLSQSNKTNEEEEEETEGLLVAHSPASSPPVPTSIPTTNNPPANEDEVLQDGAAAAATAITSPSSPAKMARRSSSSASSAPTDLTRVLQLRVDEWTLSPAPDSNDVIYDSLNMSVTAYWAWQITTIVAFLAVLMFLTTPISFLSFFSTSSPDLAGAIQSGYSQFMSRLPRRVSDFFFSFLPQLFLVLCDSWLLFGVQLMARFIEPAYTYSGREISIMHKSFAFLLFNTLLLPSLALTSVGAFLASMLWGDTNGDGASSPLVVLGRVFVTSSGAFSLAFIAVQTWLGGLMDLARVTERIFHYCNEYVIVGGTVWGRIMAVLGRRVEPPSRPSDVETTSLPAPQVPISPKKFEYEIGSNHAMLQTMFAITLVFSIVVPCILPFSLIYFCHKSAIDEYFMVVEASSHPLDSSLRARVARVSVSMLFWPVLLLQAALLGFFSGTTCSESTLTTALLTQQHHPRNLCLNARGVAGAFRMRGSVGQVVFFTVMFVLSCLYVLNDSRKRNSVMGRGGLMANALSSGGVVARVQ